ncbi:MAG: prepilin-type N-terminal cleavage/methylation domain-containing protein [Coriobacteriia bacterium]|nr:prepilin-type N-terminal cleavage/methylation domain-containing protein [Coriobacteriia bacterium]
MTRRATALRCDQGFTLLEVIFVVLIMSILLGIAIATFVASTGAANAAACRSNQDALNQAVTIAASTGEPADELADLEPYIKNFDDKTTCPEDRTPLEFDAITGIISCPNHR